MDLWRQPPGPSVARPRTRLNDERLRRKATRHLCPEPASTARAATSVDPVVSYHDGRVVAGTSSQGVSARRRQQSTRFLVASRAVEEAARSPRKPCRSRYKSPATMHACHAPPPEPSLVRRPSKGVPGRPGYSRQGTESVGVWEPSIKDATRRAHRRARGSAGAPPATDQRWSARPSPCARRHGSSA
jgi:hypothetical protein